MADKKTTIVTGASQGIGGAVVRAFLARDYNVVGTARGFSGASFTPSPNLALVEVDIGLTTTAEKIVQTAIEKKGSISGQLRSEGHGPHQEPDVLRGEEMWPVMNSNNKPAMKPSTTECPHSWTGLSCPECEERSYLKVLVAELLYTNQILRFDLIEARDQVERIERVGADREGTSIHRPKGHDLEITFPGTVSV
jgi:hypothetical protein